jgi:hypothetical protein
MAATVKEKFVKAEMADLEDIWQESKWAGITQRLCRLTD